MRPNETAAMAAAFGAEGVDTKRGIMVQRWVFICHCISSEAVYASAAPDVGAASLDARALGWRYTSKRGWECPAHAQRVAGRLHRKAK